MKKYIIFDLDWTLIKSMWEVRKIVFKTLSHINPDIIEKASYIFETTKWMPLNEQITLILWEWYNHKKITEEIYEKLENIDSDFFPWALDLIHELKDNYKLFLSTWNSTQTAINHLQKWWVKDFFEIIIWSDKTPKWTEHIDIFKDFTQDNDFYKNSIYVWDWEKDREIANYFWIDFIFIWDNSQNDKYVIKEVKELKELKQILKIIN